MTWFGWLGLALVVVYGGLGAICLFVPPKIQVGGMSNLFGLAAFGFALLVWGAVAY